MKNQKTQEKPRITQKKKKKTKENQRNTKKNRRRSSVLPLNLSDTAATSQYGSYLEFIAAIADRQCYI